MRNRQRILNTNGYLSSGYQLSYLQPGVVANACNPVTWRLGLLNGLRLAFLGLVVLCRSDVWRQYGEHSEVCVLQVGQRGATRLRVETQQAKASA